MPRPKTLNENEDRVFVMIGNQCRCRLILDAVQFNIYSKKTDCLFRSTVITTYRHNEVLRIEKSNELFILIENRQDFQSGKIEE